MKQLSVSLQKAPIITTASSWGVENFPENVLQLPHSFASDVLKNFYPYWGCRQAVLLDLPTGRGKTTLILRDLVDFAYKKGRKILILSNRVSLDVAIKKELAKKFRSYQGCPPSALHDFEEFGNVVVKTYQSMLSHLSDYSFCEKFSYIVCDETHFFTSDSTFNGESDIVLQKIPLAFSHAMRLYLSATPAEVIPYIMRAEFDTLPPHLRHEFYCCNETQKVGFAKEFFPIIYRMAPDFSHVKLRFYTDDSTPLALIQNSGSGKKFAFFVASKERGKQFHELLKDSLFLNADDIAKKPSIINQIIEKEKFDEQVLISTSVFCNGCNIKDSRVDTIFVENLDHVEILQMVGRRRKMCEDDRFTLYLKIPDVEMLALYIQKANTQLAAIAMGEISDSAFINNSFAEKFCVADAKKMAFYQNKTLHFNQIGIEQLRKQREYYEFLQELLQNEGEDGYCRYIAAKLFGKEYHCEMLDDVQNGLEETLEWLNELVDEKVELSEFRAALLERIEKIDKHNRVREDRKGNLQRKALNTLMRKVALPFMLVKKDDALVLMHTENTSD